ncbi:uncharacterized protein METZ01_LOCUS149986 [marine metagenome]|uniref:Uncharacterized protein n=1 Tax=marine metagenome TaxID=408172 RepID=A0A382A7Q4_9ZZZZ
MNAIKDTFLHYRFLSNTFAAILPIDEDLAGVSY